MDLRRRYASARVISSIVVPISTCVRHRLAQPFDYDKIEYGLGRSVTENARIVAVERLRRRGSTQGIDVDNSLIRNVINASESVRANYSLEYFQCRAGLTRWDY